MRKKTAVCNCASKGSANSRKLRVIMARPKHSTFWLSLYLDRKEANEIKVNLRYASSPFGINFSTVNRQDNTKKPKDHFIWFNSVGSNTFQGE
jgi:hypothetical protein